jgi:expansin (peptidoglycan-binding protein)
MTPRRWAAAASVLGALLVTALVWRIAAADDACAAIRAAATKPGQATFYDLAGDVGNCNFEPPADDLYVALGPGEYDAAASCGAYLDVTGPRGTVRVKVFDQCPECGAGHLDLSRTAFARIADTSDGLVPIRYRRVPDPSGHGRLAVRVAKGSSQYWLALVVEEAGNGLTKVEVRSRGGSFRGLEQADFNYWTAESGAGPGPFDVRVTDDRGHRVTATGVDLRPEVLQRTSARLYGCGSTATTAERRATATESARPRATPTTPRTTEPAVSATAADATTTPAATSDAYRASAEISCD